MEVRIDKKSDTGLDGLWRQNPIWRSQNTYVHINIEVLMQDSTTLMWEKKVYRRSPRVFDDAIVPKTSILSVAILSKGLKDRK